MDSTDLAFAGIARQAELIRAGEVSPRELVELYLARIQRLDPQLNAFRIVLAEQALAEADRARERLDAGEEAPLLGVPVAVKDLVDVEGVSTMCGTGIDPGPAREDCAAVRRLREAGAVIIGKTHVPELGASPTTESATWGVTRNPWSFYRTAGGSSGGSAAAVAAGLVGAALGTDFAGSIRIPAACCGLFGLKPQRERIPTFHPDREYQTSGLEAFGPLTRTVYDSALFTDAITGIESRSPIPAPPPAPPLVKAAKTKPKKLRIAISFKPNIPGVHVSDTVRRPVHETAELLKSLGHETREHDPEYRSAIGAAYLGLSMGELPPTVEWLTHPERLERRTRTLWRMSKLMPGKLTDRALAAQPKLVARFLKLFDDFDALITPVLAKPPVEVGHWEGLGVFRGMIRQNAFIPFTPTLNFTGQPAASIPAGFDKEGVPQAVQLVGRPNDEATIISLAAQIEAERPWADRRPDMATADTKVVQVT